MTDNPRRTRQEPSSGEWWVRCDAGHEHYGEHGAAGLLVFCQGRYLLQERPPWADHGGTWGIPGGALNEYETALVGALREAAEEGVDVYRMRPTEEPLEVVVDHGGWAYTTMLVVVDGRPRTRRTREAYDWAWVRGVDIFLERGPKRFHPAVVDFFTEYRRELPG